MNENDRKVLDTILGSEEGDNEEFFFHNVLNYQIANTTNPSKHNNTILMNILLKERTSSKIINALFEVPGLNLELKNCNNETAATIVNNLIHRATATRGKARRKRKKDGQKSARIERLRAIEKVMNGYKEAQRRNNIGQGQYDSFTNVHNLIGGPEPLIRGLSDPLANQDGSSQELRGGLSLHSRSTTHSTGNLHINSRYVRNSHWIRGAKKIKPVVATFQSNLMVLGPQFKSSNSRGQGISGAPIMTTLRNIASLEAPPGVFAPKVVESDIDTDYENDHDTEHDNENEEKHEAGVENNNNQEKTDLKKDDPRLQIAVENDDGLKFLVTDKIYENSDSDMDGDNESDDENGKAEKGKGNDTSNDKDKNKNHDNDDNNENNNKNDDSGDGDGDDDGADDNDQGNEVGDELTKRKMINNDSLLSADNVSNSSQRRDSVGEVIDQGNIETSVIVDTNSNLNENDIDDDSDTSENKNGSNEINGDGNVNDVKENVNGPNENKISSYESKVHSKDLEIDLLNNRLREEFSRDDNVLFCFFVVVVG